MKEKAGVMKTMRKMAIVGCVACLSAGSALATDWHVATNGNDAADGTTWATAKLTIQAAVDAAGDGDTVWASNGVYATGGGRVVVGTWPNRVAIDKPITLQSANGPETTFIVGAGMRCAYVTNGATLSGFTLTNGATALKMGPFDPGTVDHNGGGAACEGGAVLTNCVLAGNWACERGGGSSGGLLDNCTLTGNSAWNAGGGSDGGMLNHCALVNNHADTAGGGSLGGTLNDCTLAGNSSSYGGGAIGSALNDCILQDNYGGSEGGGVFGGTLNRCVLSGTRSLKGGGAARDAILNDCLLTGNEASETEEGMRGGGGAHGCVLRNCTVADNSAHEGGGVFNCTVLNGIVWGNAAPYSPDWIGGAFTNSCTAPHPGGTGNIANDPRFEDAQAGNFRLHFASPCIDGGANTLVAGTTDLNGNARIANGTVDMGAYEHWRLYVATNGSDGASGISWAAPKQTVQAAIDAAAPNGGTVWVSNGVYETGGRAVGIGEVTNRVAIDRSITVRSVNGADVTVIRGQNMGGRIRCVYVGSHAVLSGFALVNGLAVGYATNNAGGGVFVAGGTVANCLIGGNNAPEGGGAYIADAGTLSHCRLIGNSAGSAGAGGGVFSSSGGRLQNCLISDNFAEWAPGVYVRGGGLELVNCTISGNSSFGGPAVVAPTSTLWNCIVHGNNVETNHLEIEGIPAAMHCCSPGLAGAGNVTNDPQFADAAAGDYRLQAISPCIDGGDKAIVDWDEDLDGTQRILYGAVDMGVYEAQLPGPGAWFGAITNGLTNDLDCAAGDGVPNLLKYATSGSPRISDEQMLMTRDSGNGAPTLRFNRNPNATDIMLIVEGAEAISNGAAWRGLATNINGSWGGVANVNESGTGNPVVVTVEDPAPLLTNRFLRLKVTRP